MMLRRLRPVTRVAAVCLGLLLVSGPLLVFGVVAWKEGTQLSPETYGSLLLLFAFAAPTGAVLLASAVLNLDCVELLRAPVPATYMPPLHVVGGNVAEEMAADEALMQEIRSAATTDWASHVLYRRILLARIGRLTLTLDSLAAMAHDDTTGFREDATALREQRLRVAALLSAVQAELSGLPKWRRAPARDVAV